MFAPPIQKPLIRKPVITTGIIGFVWWKENEKSQTETKKIPEVKKQEKPAGPEPQTDISAVEKKLPVKSVTNPAKDTGFLNTLKQISGAKNTYKKHPEYGCNLDEMLFEPLTTSLKTKMKDFVFTAIYNFEPRIKPLDVILTGKDLDGLIEIEVQYLVKATNSRYNIVYPYYLIEGRSNK